MAFVLSRPWDLRCMGLIHVNPPSTRIKHTAPTPGWPRRSELLVETIPTTFRPRASSLGQAAGRDLRDVVLVLGGNGFVGSAAAKAAVQAGYDVISLSRRGAPASPGGEAWEERVRWLRGDLVREPEEVRHVLAEVQQQQRVAGVVHTIGMLIETGANAVASGSGSIPSEGSTYDQVTRLTALAAAAALAEASRGPSPPPFVFVSAAEAGWTESVGGDPFFTPDFLRRYLAAKRAVEAKLLEYGRMGSLRPVILRPSLVYSADRLLSLPAVAAFKLGNALGIPGIDRPVTVDTVAAAAVAALQDEGASGIFDYKGMERLADQL